MQNNKKFKKHFSLILILTLCFQSSYILAAGEDGLMSSIPFWVIVIPVFIALIWAASSIVNFVDSLLKSREHDIYVKHDMKEYLNQE